MSKRMHEIIGKYLLIILIQLLVFVETRLFERLKITANDNQYLAVA